MRTSGRLTSIELREEPERECAATTVAYAPRDGRSEYRAYAASVRRPKSVERTSLRSATQRDRLDVERVDCKERRDEGALREGAGHPRKDQEENQRVRHVKQEVGRVIDTRVGAPIVASSIRESHVSGCQLVCVVLVKAHANPGQPRPVRTCEFAVT